MVEWSGKGRAAEVLRFVQARLPLLLAAFLLGNLIAILFTALQPSGSNIQSESEAYTYHKKTAANGVKLHAIRTRPNNIALKPIQTNVTLTDEFGINGGFFWNGDLLSIAVVNDQPLLRQQGDYGSGWYNIDVPKGTLVWDEITGLFSVQVAIDAEQLQVTDKRHYWAQGGVSMSLQHESSWVQQALEEEMPAFNESRLRSGAVYDNKQRLWLLVSDTPCTVEQFRAAVVELVGRDSVIEGVFLDGDGSSQMRCAQMLLKGDSREVYQMLALKRK
jgi:hypothetical protein